MSDEVFAVFLAMFLAGGIGLLVMLWVYSPFVVALGLTLLVLFVLGLIGLVGGSA